MKILFKDVCVDIEYKVRFRNQTTTHSLSLTCWVSTSDLVPVGSWLSCAKITFDDRSIIGLDSESLERPRSSRPDICGFGVEVLVSSNIWLSESEPERCQGNEFCWIDKSSVSVQGGKVGAIAWLWLESEYEIREKACSFCEGWICVGWIRVGWICVGWICVGWSGW